jgi:5-methylcytosine-specific restriction endonuclease McrA
MKSKKERSPEYQEWKKRYSKSPERLAKGAARSRATRSSWTPEERAANSEYMRTYYSANKERHRERGSEWKERNKARHRKYQSSYQTAYSRKVKKRGVLGSHTPKEWQAVLTAYGRKCVDCGANGRLTKDHEVPTNRGGSNFAFNLRPRCRSCNSKKNDKMEAGLQHSIFDLREGPHAI